MRRAIMDALKRSFFHIYSLGTRLGVHILPVHYYAAEPDIVSLKKTKPLWSHASLMGGIDVDLDEQLTTLRSICLQYQAEYAGNPFYRTAVAEHSGPGFGYIEAQALYAVVRSLKPARIIEVGSGVSTFMAHAALDRNLLETGLRGKITCIEPFPSARLRRFVATTPEMELVTQPVQQAPLDLYDSLQANDILFVDSSHVVKAGSDVVHVVLEVLPRLRPGVLVHFHDIYFPYSYQRDLLTTFLHNNETPFVQAFLAFSSKYRILFCLSMLHYERPADLRAIFPEYDPQPNDAGLRKYPCPPGKHFPSSLWLKCNR